MAALESKMDAEGESLESAKKKEDAEAEDEDEAAEDLEPSKEEKFTNEHADEQELAKSKKNIEAKNKKLSEEGSKDEVNLEKTRLANKPY